MEAALSQENLPSLSPLAARLLQMAADEDSSAEGLAAVIEQDPGLTTRLLRLVNSAAYRRGSGEISNVTRAVVRLGLREIRIMALSVSLRDTLPISPEGPDYSHFWRASLHRAVLARQLAQSLGQPEAEDAFVAGLLTEVGLPVLLRAISKEESRGFPGMAASLGEQVAWEHRRLGLDHRELGRHIVEAWGLPRILVDCQRIVPLHLRQGPPPLVMLVDFARRAVEAYFSSAVSFDEVFTAAQRRFDLPPEQLQEVLLNSLDNTAQTAEALEIELDGEADLLEVLAKARQAVVSLRDELRAAGGGQPLGEVKGPLGRLGGFVGHLARRLGPGQARDEAKALDAEARELDRILRRIEAQLAERD